jgi:hypothetical protein
VCQTKLQQLLLLLLLQQVNVFNWGEGRKESERKP